MHAFEHKVLRCSDEFLFAAGIAAPEQKDDRLLMLVLNFSIYGPVKVVQPRFYMAVRLPAAYGQSRVRHEHTALRPLGERAVLGRYNAEITLQLLEDVLQARRRLNTRLNRKAKSVRLSGTVIRVLPENDGLDLGIRRVPQSVKDVLCRRIDGLLGVFLFSASSECACNNPAQTLGKDLAIPIVAKMYHAITPPFSVVLFLSFYVL